MCFDRNLKVSLDISRLNEFSRVFRINEQLKLLLYHLAFRYSAETISSGLAYVWEKKAKSFNRSDFAKHGRIIYPLTASSDHFKNKRSMLIAYKDRVSRLNLYFRIDTGTNEVVDSNRDIVERSILTGEKQDSSSKLNMSLVLKEELFVMELMHVNKHTSCELVRKYGRI